MTTAGSPRLTVSPAPHLHGSGSVRRVIWTVNACLAPTALMGVLSFGPYAAVVIAVCVATAVGAEFAYQKLMKKPVTVSDGSALLTGLLLSFNLPPGVPLHVAAIGSFVAIVLAKQLFGGLGFTIFNPALVGRAFLQASFPAALSTWSAPLLTFSHVDALSAATPLTVLKKEGALRLAELFGTGPGMYYDLLLGHKGGCIGENAAVALLAGGMVLLALRYISWHIPVSFIGSAALFAWIFGGRAGFFSGDPVLHILCGGIILGAFFMATDYVTSPVKKRGQFIFGAGCGVLTMVIRFWGGFPEGVMFAILVMNCFTPLIDRAVRPRVFGYLPEKKYDR